MKPSIRTFLLINLLISVTLILSLGIIGNLYLAHRDIQHHTDAHLIRMTDQLRILLDTEEPLTTTHIKLLQKAFSNSSHALQTNARLAPTEDINSEAQFQVWNKNKQLILHSNQVISKPFTNGKVGLSTQWIDEQSWRIYTYYDSTTQLTYMIGMKIHYRYQLENQLTRDAIFVMLITYPFLGFLIWIIVGKSFEPLRAIIREVSHRAPNYLKPVNARSAPTEILPLITALNTLFQRLQDTIEKEKRFTADAAHELRTPLAALSTYTQIALRAKTPEERQEALLKVLNGVNRGTHVIQQLLTLSRMDPQASIQDPIPVDLAKEAADTAAMLAPEAIAKNIDLELIAPEPCPPMMGTPTAISILLRNLIDNAIRYSPSDTQITIRIEDSGDFIVLRVIDNGPGIPDELKERVFERFYRVIGSKVPGSGLGLGIVQQIAKLHHATITLKTPKNGIGLDFQIHFPKKQPKSLSF